jgi:hypothetical protein
MIKNIEKIIYNLVKKNEKLKNILKYIYQAGFSLISKKKHYAKFELSIRSKTFFGFHDKSPWSPSMNYLLGHSFEGVGNESINSIDKVDIALFDDKNWMRKKVIANTRSWNWQQGSQLQWIDENRIVFNDFVNEQCVGRIINKKGENLSYTSYSVGAISPKKNVYVSFCFKELGNAMPGYGYNFSKDNIQSNTPQLSLVIDKLQGHDESSAKFIDCSNIGKLTLKANSKLFLSHTQFSPGGETIAFMKRLANDGKRIVSELFLLNTVTNKIAQVPFYNMVSHFCFVDDNSILAYANTKDSGDGYYLVNIQTMEIKNYTERLCIWDGHPSASSRGEVVFDTYPDRSRHQTLFFWKGGESKAIEIAKLHAPLNFKNDCRVDLHPRVSPNGEFVCFDSSFTGIRSMCVMKLK